MKICAVIVTYSDRYNLLVQVLYELLIQKCNKIIIVSNNSKPDSLKKLKAYIKNHTGKIDIILLSENTGSANGFATGIRHVIDLKIYDFIWLLDDDNKPQPDSLALLKQFWIENKLEKSDTALLSLRKRGGYSLYERAIDEGKPYLLPGPFNVFRSFHYRNLILSFFRSDKKPVLHKTSGIINAAPYGGLFFHKDLIKKIGYPDKDMVLYFDDYEFTYRIHKNNGKIYLVTNSQINDIDTSWHEFKSGNALAKISSESNYLRLYYSIRNRVYFEIKDLVTCRAEYYFNMIIYTMVLIIFCTVKLKFKNIQVYITALFHGLQKKMGINEKYQLL